MILKTFFIILLIGCVCAEFKLTVLHTNDVHARVAQTNKFGGPCSNQDVKENKCFGGVARRKTLVDQLRTENQNVLLLDAGDQFQGTSWFLVYEGIEASYFMSKIGYDVMSLGNHEFDLGPKKLRRVIDNGTFSFISANTDVSKEPLLKDVVSKSVVIQKDGIKIGIIGYTGKRTPFVSNPGPTLTFSDEVEAVRLEAAALKARGVEHIIALGHAGFQIDQKIAAQVPEVDVVVGGYSDTFLYTGKPPTDDHNQPEDLYPTMVQQGSGKQVPVVQTHRNGKYLGVLHVTFDDNGEVTKAEGNPVILDGSIQQDQELQTEVAAWEADVKKFGDDVMGDSYVDLDGSASTCRRGECNLGNLIANAMVTMNLRPPQNGSWTRASAAFWNSGGIRASMKIGRITGKDITDVLPYKNTISQVELKGEDLILVFEHSVAAYGENNITGRFLQISGLRVKFNVKRPSGKRVMSLDILCADCKIPKYEPVDKSKTYVVLANTFLVNGGDKFVVLKEKAKKVLGLGTLISDAVANYIRRYSPVYNGLENRIEFVEKPEQHEDRKILCVNRFG